MLLLFAITAVYTVYATIFDPENSSLPLAVAVLGVLGAIAAIDQLWDRFRPIDIGETDRVPSEEIYLKRRLQEFQKEEALFVELAGKTQILLKYDKYSDAFIHQKRGGRIREYDDIQQAVLDENHTQFVIVGDPGAGKSTTLRHLAMGAIHVRLGERDTLIDKLYAGNQSELPIKPTDALVPLWINLGSSENPPDAENLIEHWWNKFVSAEGSCKNALENGAVWLFLDGLNEMPEQYATRKQQAASLKTFLKKYPKVRAIVTCRVLDYDENLNLELPVVYVRPLDAPRIETFIRKRFPEETSRLLEKIDRNEALRRIAKNPYTLVMLIDIYSERETLPEKLSDLYDLYRIYTSIRYNEYRKRGLLYLPQKQLERKLQKLAFQMINQYKGTTIEVKWAQKQIYRRALKDGFAMGLLVSDGENVRFFHQSLYGYYALPLLQKALEKKWFDFSEARYIERIRLLMVGITILGEEATPLVPILVNLFKSKNQYINMEVIWVLNRIGVFAIPILLEYLNDEDVQVRLNVLAVFNLLAPLETIPPALIEMLKDKDKLVREYAARSLGRMGVSEATESLIEMLGDANNWIRFQAEQALMEIDTPEAREALRISKLKHK